MAPVSVAAQTGNASPWIEIFRAGDYRPQGKMLITRDDLDRVVRNYDPSFHEAPIVVGHPKDNGPAFGWVARLAMDGDTLLAQERQVDPEFSELRRSGRYKKRSASFYKDADGKVSGLRHVGYLGALPPEVKGLKDVQFDDRGKEFAEIDFGEEGKVAETKDGIGEAIADYFRKLFSGSATAPAQFSESAVREIVSAAVALAVDPLKVQIGAQEAKLAAQATSFSERESKLTASELRAKAQDAISRLKAKGKWIPAFDAMGGSALFTELAGATTTIEFGEGSAKKTLTPLETLENFLESLPAIVPTGTRFNPAAANRATVVNYSERADPNSVQLHELAMKRSQDKNIDYGEALRQVGNENPNLCQPGNATAGAV